MALYCKIINFYFTFVSWLVFSIKFIIDDVIGAMLGFLLATQAVGDTSPTRRGYIACVIIAITMIYADRYVRSVSKTFDIWKTLTGPVNIGIKMCKVLYYRKYNHALQVTALLVFEIIKIITCTYCIVILAVEIEHGIFLNYLLFGVLITNSLLGIMLYLPMLINIIFVKDFYHRLLIEFARWYLECVIHVKVIKEGHTITVEFAQLDICV